MKNRYLRRLEKLILNEVSQVRQQNLINKYKIVYKFNELKLVFDNREILLKKSNSLIKEKNEYLERKDILELIKGLAA